MSIQPSPLKSAVASPRPGPYLAGDAGGDADVGEGAVSAVQIQPAGQRRVAVGRAVVARAGGAEARRVGLHAVPQVAGDVEIQPSVPIDVHKRRGGAPGRMVGAARRRPIRKGAVAVVVPQLVGRVELGQVQIDVPVIVDVACGDAHPVTARSDTGSGGHVHELQVPCSIRISRQVVPEEPVARRKRGRAGRSGGHEGLALHQVHVQVAIAVVVEKRHAGGQYLGHVELPGHAVDMGEAKAR